MTTLVTGANGFVAINIARYLAQKGTSVIALARRPPDRDSEQFLVNEADRIVWVEADIRDRDGLVTLAREHQVDRIIHSASITPSAVVEKTQGAMVVDVNLVGTVNLLEAALAARAKRFVFVSSTGLYGAPVDPKIVISEDVPLMTTKLYTICKFASEQLCLRYSQLHGLSIAIARLGSAYGPMERASQSRENMSIVYELVQRALAGGTLRIFGAEHPRDYCYIDDVAEAFTHLTLGDQLSWQIYNVATATPTTTRDVLQVLSQYRPDFSWIEVATPDEADMVILPERGRPALDMSRMHHDFGFTLRYPLPSGLQTYLDWLSSGQQ